MADGWLAAPAIVGLGVAALALPFAYSLRRPTRFAFRAEETPEDPIEALKNADYSHLPELHDRLGQAGYVPGAYIPFRGRIK